MISSETSMIILIFALALLWLYHLLTHSTFGRDDDRLTSKGRSAYGFVVRSDVKETAEGNIYRTEISFKDHLNNEHIITTTGDEYKENSQIEIIYDPDNPGNSRIKDELEKFQLQATIFTYGMPVAIVLLIIILMTAKEH